ncbi:MAG: collagen binding domain-containing protein [Clostridia bacterium]
MENYKLDDTIYTTELQANKVTTIEITNEVKKGQIKVIKVDKDNNQIKLKGVKFEIYDNNNNLIQTLVTDENGEAITDRLPIDKEYIIKEIETNENYVLNEECITVTLKEDEIKELTFENELKKGQIQVIKVDSENNEIYIPDTTFEIYNSKGELVDTITTDESGKAISKRLPINDEYTMRETISNKSYVLNEDIQKVILQEDEITDIVFENTKIYGKIKINKVSSDYSKILDLPANSPIANTKFLVVNSNGEVMGVYTTDESGSVITNDLPYGEYTVYEYEAPEHFIKDATPQKVLITENNQITELTFKNAPVEPKLPKTGF